MENSQFIEEIVIQDYQNINGEKRIPLNKNLTMIAGDSGSFFSAISFVFGESLENLGFLNNEQLVEWQADSTKTSVTIKITDASGNSETFQRSIEYQARSSGADLIESFKINGNNTLRSVYLHHLEQRRYELKNLNHPEISVEKLMKLTPIEVTKIIEHLSGSSAKEREYNNAKYNLDLVELQLNQSHRQILQLKHKQEAVKKEQKSAEEYVQLDNNVKKLKLDLNLVLLFRLDFKIDVYERKLRQIADEIDEIDIQNVQAKYTQVLQEISERSSQISSHEKEFFYYLDLISDKKIRLNQITANLNSFNANQRKHLARVQHQITEFANQIEEADKNRSELLDVKGKLEVFIANIDQFQAIYDDGSDIHDEYDLLEAEFSLEDMARPPTNQSFTRDYLKQSIASKKSEIAELSARLIVMLEAEKTCRVLEVELNRLQSQEAEATKKIESIKDQMKVAEEFEKREVKKKVVQILESQFSGVNGRLCDLIVVKEGENSKIVESVFSEYWDAIVVDNLEVAYKCVDFLKFLRMENEMFLPVNSLVIESQKLPTNPENHRIYKIADLLEDFTEENIKKAVLFVSNPVSVAATCTQAFDLALKSEQKFNVVSETGILFEKNYRVTGFAPCNETSEKTLLELNFEKIEEERKLQDLWLEKGMKKAEVLVANENFKTMQDEREIISGQVQKIKGKIESLKKELDETGEESPNTSNPEELHYKDFCVKWGISDIDHYRNFEFIKENPQQALESLNLKIENAKKLSDHLKATKGECDKTLAELNGMTANESWIETKTQLTAELPNLEAQIQMLHEKIRDLKETLAPLNVELANTSHELERNQKEKFMKSKIWEAKNRLLQERKAEKYSLLMECLDSDVKIELDEGELVDFMICSATDDEEARDLNLNRIKINYTSISRHHESLRNSDSFDLVKNTIAANLELAQNKLNRLKTPQSNYAEHLELLRNQFTAAQTKNEDYKVKLSIRQTMFEEIKRDRKKMFDDCLQEFFEFVNEICKIIFDMNDNVKYLTMDENEPYLGGICVGVDCDGLDFKSINEVNEETKAFVGTGMLLACYWYTQTPFAFFEFNNELAQTQLFNFLKDQQLFQAIISTDKHSNVDFYLMDSTDTKKTQIFSKTDL